jgi:hypothetical protein
LREVPRSLLKQLDEHDGGVERIGDSSAIGQRERRAELSRDLGKENGLMWWVGAVELRQTSHSFGVVGKSEAECDRNLNGWLGRWPRARPLAYVGVRCATKFLLL